MKINDIRAIAKDKGVSKYYKLNKSALIRAIQKMEGNQECFGSNPSECNQANCLWREDCELIAK